MHPRRFASGLAALCLLAGPPVVVAADDATLLRVFLTDGTSLVSYGELARVGNRVVFSMPTAAMPNPPLHLVNILAERVDWERTNRYAASARAAHYIETQADLDYWALSNQIAQALNDVTWRTDAAKRLAIAEDARKILAEWPGNHYNYRQAEVRQMLSLFDEAIADLRAASGGQRFDLSLLAFAVPPPNLEPLLPAPTPKEAIELTLMAAGLVDVPADRPALLSAALASLNRDASVLLGDWATSTRAEINAAIRAELRVDRSYQSLTKRMMALADQRARLADVRGVERVVARVHQGDAVLGGKRPDAVNLLLVAVLSQLDAAQQLRLARDRWAVRAPAFRSYGNAIRSPMANFALLKPSLEGIKSLSGTSSATLAMLQRSVDRILTQASAVVPPDELLVAHALLVSAVQLAGTAGQIRREATRGGDLARAWDASSAAAGALMLGARAKSDIQTLLDRPQLR